MNDVSGQGKDPGTVDGHYLIIRTDCHAMTKAVAAGAFGLMMDPVSRSGRPRKRPDPRCRQPSSSDAKKLVLRSVSAEATLREAFPSSGISLVNQVFGVWLVFEW